MAGSSRGYEQKRNEIFHRYRVRERQKEWESRLRHAFENQGKDLEWDFSVTEFRAGYDGAEKILRAARTSVSKREQERLMDYFVGHVGPDFGRDKEIAAELKCAREELAALNSAQPPIRKHP